MIQPSGGSRDSTVISIFMPMPVLASLLDGPSTTEGVVTKMLVHGHAPDIRQSADIGDALVNVQGAAAWNGGTRP